MFREEIIMNKTPRGSRPHVTIFGETNSGKSSLFNALINANHSIVSPIAGTTTDLVGRSIELLPFGPIYLTDTAGLNDDSELGKERMEKTRRAIDGADYAIYTIDIGSNDRNTFKQTIAMFEQRNTPYIIVFTKKDIYNEEEIKKYIDKNKITNTTLMTSQIDFSSIDNLRTFVAGELTRLKPNSGTLMTDGILEKGATAVSIITVDSETPIGRLILPQVQFIRECVDKDIVCVVTTPNSAKTMIEKLQQLDLVVVDSQIFSEVAEMLPKETPLVSFSILVARAKGDLTYFVKGIDAIGNLKDGANILISEACAHNTNHEDIGKVKIPAMLNNLTRKQLNYHFMGARDFPQSLKNYDLVIHCGGCMLTRKEMISRINLAKDEGIPITNYGVLLAYGNGILERCLKSVRIYG